MYDNLDMAITEDGDLTLSEIEDTDGVVVRDLSLTRGKDQVEQTINIRLKTKIGELFLHPDVGNELMDIIGERNTRETADRGRKYLIYALTNRSMIDPNDIIVTPIPVDENKILYSLQVSSSPYSDITLVLEVDLKQGVRRIV